MAITYASGYRDITGQVSQKQKPDYDEVMHMLEPDNTSMSFLFKKFGYKKAVSQEFYWFEDRYIPSYDAINYSTGYNTTDTSFTVDNSGYFVVGDLVQNERTTEVYRVIASGTNTIGVVRGATGYAINDNDVLRILANASSEGSDAPNFASTKENKLTGYCQTIKTAIGMTEDAALEPTWVNEKDWPYQLRKKLKEHGIKLEQAFIWSNLRVTSEDQSTTGYGDGTATMFFMGGLHYWLNTYCDGDKKKDFNGTLTRDSFIKDFLEPAMEFGTDNKILFAGTTILGAISYWKLGILEMVPKDKTFDLRITNWISPFGTIKLVHHKQLNTPKVGTSAKGCYGFLVDFGGENSPKYMERRKTKRSKVIIADGADLRKEQILTQAGLKVPDPNRHAFCYGVIDYS